MCITENEREYLLGVMEELLEEYDYSYTTDALDRIINTWATEKETLITAFKRHPNYIDGKFMIAFDCDYDREINKLASENFGKYITHVAAEMRETLPEEIDTQRREERCICLPSELWDFFCNLYKYAERTISEQTANKLIGMVPAIRPRAGEKTSRCINRLCTYLGYNKHTEYNREFAKYADSLSPLTIKRHTILSLHPNDYLTMSFGNSWASCHTIDKENKRGMPNSYEGMYSSGTMSYMLDPSSMVFYIVDAAYDGNEYYTQPKINRQMFHWGEDKLVQGRLYPQANDGNGSAYTPYRNIVQEIMSKIFNFNNLWVLKRGTENVDEYIRSRGTHYRDYSSFDECTLSIIRESNNRESFVVGHDPICIYCGNEHDIQGNINCCAMTRCCSSCGDEIDEEDIIWLDGRPYCRDCCHYCDHCDEYHMQDEIYVRDVGYVCEHCIEEHYTYCEDCDRYHHNNDVRYVDSVDRYVCDNCLDEYYYQCEECEEYFLKDDMNPTDDNRWLCDDCFKKEEEKNDEE